MDWSCLGSWESRVDWLNQLEMAFQHIFEPPLHGLSPVQFARWAAPYPLHWTLIQSVCNDGELFGPCVWGHVFHQTATNSWKLMAGYPCLNIAAVKFCPHSSLMYRHGELQWDEGPPSESYWWWFLDFRGSCIRKSKSTISNSRAKRDIEGRIRTQRLSHHGVR